MTITIKAPAEARLKLLLVGDSPLLCNQFGLKSRKAMLNAAAGITPDKQPRDLDLEFRESLYLFEEGRYGFPCAGIRTSMIDACRGISLKMAEAKQILWVVGSGWDINTRVSLVPLEGAEPYPHEEFPSKGNGGGRSLVITARFDFWVLLSIVKWDPSRLGDDSACNLLARAGVMVGLGYHRLQSGGPYGAFHIADDEERRALGYGYWE